MNRLRYSMWIAAIFFALILSAMNVAPALADEAPPPDVSTPAETGEEATPPAEGATDSASSAESSSVAEIIESLPEDTTLVVVDENGEALSLASEEAAETIELADPQWCPVGVVPGSPTCSGVKTSFNGANPLTNLIQWLKDNQPNQAGVIWIEAGYVGTSGLEGGPVVLEGGDYATMDNFALTINGGWTGTGTTLNPNTPSTFNVAFVISGWKGAVTINNIVVTGASGVTDALGVYTDGNITLNNVDVHNNTTNWGTYLQNDSGTGNVTVNDSTFNNNTSAGASGVVIGSKGTVTVKNVTANGNTLNGVYIDNSNATTPKAVTINGTNHFSYNGLDGLYVLTKGAITLNNVTAMGNTGGSGAYLDNCIYNFGTGLCNFGVANGVTIKGTNNFSDNGWDGLRVWSGGVITVSNITANGNGTDAGRNAASASPDNFDAFGKGALLHNWGSLTPKNIVVSGTNTFNNNASTGLLAYGWGSVTVNNLTANGNGCNLTKEVNNFYCAGAYLEGQAGVTQTGYGRFDGNIEYGLRVSAFNKGAVVLNNLYADNNGETGVNIFAFGTPPINVTINGINTFTNNGAEGLVILADGVVTLNNLTANYNGLDGAYIDNTSAPTPKAVIIKGINNFNGNSLGGLFVWSNGVITTNAVTANFNLGTGVSLDNCFDDGFDNCLVPSAQAVTMTGNNTMNDNGGDGGLWLLSRGAITVNNLTTNNNSGIGTLLWNQYNNAVGGITLKGFGTFLNNGTFSGLNAYSTGAITLANLTANYNNTYGVAVSNTFNPAKPANVTITGNNIFEGNGITGLRIFSYGAVVLNNLTANYNLGAGGAGVYIENHTSTMVKPVTINGTNMMNYNGGDGLVIFSLGAIKVNNLMASYNADGYGAVLDNDGSATISQPVTVTGYGIFNNNTDSGLLIYTNGNVTLANITANNNTDYGAYILAVNPITNGVANVTITGVNTFNNNVNDDGLYLVNDGMITLSNITANGNGNIGAMLDNFTNANSGPTGIKTVTVSGVNMFNNNGYDGLYIYASGNVTITRITANYNNDPGIAAANGVTVYSNAGNIAFTCGSLNNNENIGYSLTVTAGKTITIKGVYTFGNGTPTNFTSGTTTITRACPLP
ncbi:MAG: right-handed parallel beta-helix repeat-containing protein [Anaerolineales bacterium]|nr:right-handed parallel beta-helix repeat-containing protein [Anaerolineales bacterium]